jgi:hypothetical protein
VEVVAVKIAVKLMVLTGKNKPPGANTPREAAHDAADIRVSRWIGIVVQPPKPNTNVL